MVIIWTLAAILAAALTVHNYRRRARLANPLPYILTGIGVLMFVIAAIAS